jgi:hypothetical protein
MRQRFIGGAVLAAAAVFAGAGAGRAQDPAGPASPVYEYPLKVRAQAPSNAGFDAPLNTEPTIPIPTGRAGAAGFYGAAEFVIMSQTRTIGGQVVAYRGLIDSTGRITGLPGTPIGSRQEALTTQELGRTTFQPGLQVEVGYRFEDGTRLYANYLHLFDAHYSAGATLAAPFARSRPDLVDTFLTAAVFNFTPQFAGPQTKTAYDLGPGNPGFNTYGIWNGASIMDIKYTQRYQQAEIGMRMPMFQTDYSRVYGIAAGKFGWFFDRFQWRTVSPDINGAVQPQFAAFYTNTLSQRMYGPVVGCGHEVFLANQFSLSCDLTGGLLLSVVKERAKYELADRTTRAKRGREDFDIVPNANAAVNLWWYPVEGVQVRIGYSGMTYFNTKRMEEPIGFNYGAIDPSYGVQAFRLIHGVNVGFGLFF